MHNRDGHLGNENESFITREQWLHVQRTLRLTPRQMEIVQLVFTAYRSDRIARTLGLKPSNVDKHFRRLYQRTGTRDRTDLMLRVFKIILAQNQGGRCGHAAIIGLSGS